MTSNTLLSCFKSSAFCSKDSWGTSVPWVSNWFASTPVLGMLFIRYWLELGNLQANSTFQSAVLPASGPRWCWMLGELRICCTCESWKPCIHVCLDVFMFNVCAVTKFVLSSEQSVRLPLTKQHEFTQRVCDHWYCTHSVASGRGRLGLGETHLLSVQTTREKNQPQTRSG